MAGTVIEEFVAVLGWEVDDEELKEFDSAVEDLGNTLKWVSGLVAGATAAIGALVVTTNKETAEMANLAASVGLSAESLEAMTGIVENIGFQADNVVDLVEEMSNKFGEMKGLGEMTAVHESLKILNLDFKQLRDLKPEEQFTEIIDAALKLEDAQQAVSAVDMLMGGEANKILGFLRTQGETLGDLLEKYKAINLLNEEGREGAKRFTMIWGQFTGVLDSILKLFSGLVGDAIAPMVADFIDFVAANKELIQTNVKEWALSFVSVVKTLISVLRSAWRFLQPVIDRFGGLKNTAKVLALVLASVKIAKFLAAFKAIAALSKFKALLAAVASPAGILAGLLVVLGLAVEDFIVFMQGGNSVVGKLADKFADFVDNSILPLVEELTGLSEAEFKMAFADTVDGLISMFETGIPNAIDTAMAAISEFFLNVTDESLTFEERFKVIWDGLKDFVGTWFEALKAFYSALFPDLTAKIGELGTELMSAIRGFIDAYKQIVEIAAGNIQAFVGKVKGFLSGLPVVGRFFDGASPTPTPSAGALAPSQSAINNTTQSASSSSNVEMQATFNVTQGPGENSEALARRVNDLMGREVAKAVKNNNTGVVY
jgi:hypothetical protein